MNRCHWTFHNILHSVISFFLGVLKYNYKKGDSHVYNHIENRFKVVYILFS